MDNNKQKEIYNIQIKIYIAITIIAAGIIAPLALFKPDGWQILLILIAIAISFAVGFFQGKYWNDIINEGE